MTRVPITGNTYPVKDKLRGLGGRWDPNTKAWMVPVDCAEQARQIVKSAPRRKVTPTGCHCGSVEEFERASDCWNCKHDR